MAVQQKALDSHALVDIVVGNTNYKERRKDVLNEHQQSNDVHSR